MITNVGLNYLLDVGVHNGTKIGTWYIGLIDETNYTALAPADTAASHAGWQESTAYSETVRQTWDEAAAASQSTATTTVASFTMTTDTTIMGYFVVDLSTKGGATGTLLLTALRSDGPAELVAGQVLTFNLTLSAQDATN